MDLSQFNGMSETGKTEFLNTMRATLGFLEGQREDARDNSVVWIVNRHGIREVCLYGHWRLYLSKHTELRCRLLDPAEVIEEEAKVAQAHAHRAEKARLWRILPFRKREEYGGPDALSLEDLRELVERAEPVEQFLAMQARTQELEGEVPRRPRGRPRNVPAAVGADEG